MVLVGDGRSLSCGNAKQIMQISKRVITVEWCLRVTASCDELSGSPFKVNDFYSHVVW